MENKFLDKATKIEAKIVRPNNVSILLFGGLFEELEYKANIAQITVSRLRRIMPNGSSENSI
jgi:hypothetical protein